MTGEIVKAGYYRDTTLIRFYTVQLSGHAQNELMNFVIRMKRQFNNKNELGELLRHIENIGNVLGFDNEYFKTEGHADRIVTPKITWVDSNSEFGLRLYCIVLSNEIVILLNGGPKTMPNPMSCQNVRPHFVKANKIARAIKADIAAGKIKLSGFDIVTPDNYMFKI